MPKRLLGQRLLAGTELPTEVFLRQRPTVLRDIANERLQDIGPRSEHHAIVALIN